MVLHDVLLPALILAGVVGVLVLVWQIKRQLENTEELGTDQLTTAISETWRRMGLDRTIGQLETHTRDIREFHGDITRMLRDPRQRGEFGEQQLDVILSEHLPPTMYGLRERVVDGKTPDAHIKSAAGLICIDAKFPLDNYERYRADTTDTDQARYKRAFRGDVESQLEKIAQDYVDPAAGTTEFAFAFIPSEAVYYHLVTEEYDLLREYTKRGVQAVSPLTFGQKLELIKADVHAQQLTEQAEEIRDHLARLAAEFDAVENEWSILYEHLRRAKNKADDVDQAYGNLRGAFDRVDQPALDPPPD